MGPITFQPLYMPRVWGGRMLAGEYGRKLPDDAPYGESWEIVDRENEQSVVAGGTLAGTTLHELWTTRRGELFGDNLPKSARFPLLIKVLDARDDLSLQVHPPAAIAPVLGGEPKTEMWFIARADPGATLYVGLKAGTTRDQFEAALARGTVADLVHAIQPRSGQSILIPSGRLHAIGGGFLIHEIQQNSDTTYRVFDWNRPGLDGRPRDLHVAESLRSINFHDHEPAMDKARGSILAECEHFRVEKLEIAAGDHAANFHPDRFSIFSVAAGEVTTSEGRSFCKGDFFLLPRGAAPLIAATASTLLGTTIPCPQDGPPPPPRASAGLRID